jgi:hypothetical protein
VTAAATLTARPILRIPSIGRKIERRSTEISVSDSTHGGHTHPPTEPQSHGNPKIQPVGVALQLLLCGRAHALTRASPLLTCGHLPATSSCRALYLSCTVTDRPPSRPRGNSTPMHLLPFAVIAAQSVTAQYGPDFGKCTCATFCDGSCDIDDTGATNMTLYRMTQFGVVDMINKNTGDVRGDTSFVISRRTTAYECRKDPSNFMCNGLAQFQGDVPGCTDLVLKWQIEVDGKWGPYQYCNPVNSTDSSGPWACLNEIGHMGPKKPPPPPDYPPQCAANFTGSGDYCYTEPCVAARGCWFVPADTLGDCCAAVNKGATPSNYYRGFNYFAANKTCALYAGYSGGAKVEGCVSGEHIYHPDPKEAPCECKRMNMTVGRENRSRGGTGLPRSCGRNWDVHQSRYLNGTVYDTLQLPADGSIAGCCAKCGADKQCDGWQMGLLSKKKLKCSFIKNGTLLNQGNTPIASVAKTGGGGGGGGGTNVDHFGEWYSHPQMGECTGKQVVGDGSGCSWRAVGIQRAINASCLYSQIDSHIEQQDPSCFSACPTPTEPSHDNPWMDRKVTGALRHQAVVLTGISLCVSSFGLVTKLTLVTAR